MLDFCVQFRCNGQWGSGVLLQLNDTERDCIMTAAHCLEGYSKLEDIKFEKQDYQVISILKGNKDIFDVAYIFIEKQNELSFKPCNISDIECLSMEKIKVLGYPGINVGQTIKYQELNCVYVVKQDNTIKLRVTDNIESFFVEAKILIDGMSGGPVYVEKNGIIYIIGILSKATHPNFEFREINIMPFQAIIDQLRGIGIEICFQQTESILADIIERIDPGYEEWKKLTGHKDRTYKQKILDVCSDYNERRLNRFSRKIVDANLELEGLTFKQKGALLYRIFSGANDVQVELVEEGVKQLSEDDINKWIKKYTEAAKEMIRIKSVDYDYPRKNDDLINKTVIKLIDECYLSFDEEGLIE